MQYRLILGALAVTMMPFMGEGQNILYAESSAEAICTKTPPQEKPDEAVRSKVLESYGKLPMSFIRNDGQLKKQVQYYEKGAGHATYFTKQGVYLSLAGKAGREAGTVGNGYGPRIIEDGIPSNPKVQDLFLISYGEPLSQIQNRLTTANTRTNRFVRATPINELKSETCGEQSRTINNQRPEIVRLMPLGIEKDVEIVAGKEQAGKVNYLTGNDPEKWRTNIPMYESVVYKGVYDGIDMKFYGNNSQMEYDIIVKPGASPSRVQLSYEGIEGLTVAENGDLEISLKEGKVIQRKPYVYQEIEGKRVEVEGKFKIQKNAVIAGSTATKQSPAHEDEIASQGHALRSSAEARNDKSTHNPKPERFIYGFQVASYDKRYPLVIDPVLVYSTYLGGSDFDYAFGIAVDEAGNAYVAGYAGSSDFPTVSAYDASLNGDYDAFVCKIRPVIPQPTPTPEITPTPSPEPTPSPTPEPTPSPTPESTPRPSPSPNPTPSPTPTPEITPSPIPTPTGTPTAITLAYFNARAAPYPQPATVIPIHRGRVSSSINWRTWTTTG